MTIKTLHEWFSSLPQRPKSIIVSREDYQCLLEMIVAKTGLPLTFRGCPVVAGDVIIPEATYE